MLLHKTCMTYYLEFPSVLKRWYLKKPWLVISTVTTWICLFLRLSMQFDHMLFGLSCFEHSLSIIKTVILNPCLLFFFNCTLDNTSNRSGSSDSNLLYIFEILSISSILSIPYVETHFIVSLLFVANSFNMLQQFRTKDYFIIFVFAEFLKIHCLCTSIFLFLISLSITFSTYLSIPSFSSS